MNRFVRPSILLLILATAYLFGVIPAHAQSGSPQSPYVITSAPYTITKPGYYILGKNLNSAQASGDIIEIKANNVTLDFNSFYIAGPAGNTGQSTVGVRADERSNVTVKNGTIAYCRVGIYFTGNNQPSTNAVGALIDNMRITYCYFIGTELDYCPASRMTNCQVSQTGYGGAGTAFAIRNAGLGTLIQNNTVTTVTATTGYGIYALGGFARQNTIYNAAYGVYSGKYQDNLTSGCGYPVDGGIDAGGNN